jgi:hypothetical protein
MCGHGHGRRPAVWRLEQLVRLPNRAVDWCGHVVASNAFWGLVYMEAGVGRGTVNESTKRAGAKLSKRPC